MKGYLRNGLAALTLAAPLVWGGCTSITQLKETDVDKVLADFSYAESEEGYSRLEVKSSQRYVLKTSSGNYAIELPIPDVSKLVMFDGIAISEDGEYQLCGTPYNDRPDYMYFTKIGEGEPTSVRGEREVSKMLGGDAQFYRVLKNLVILQYLNKFKEDVTTKEMRVSRAKYDALEEKSTGKKRGMEEYTIKPEGSDTAYCLIDWQKDGKIGVFGVLPADQADYLFFKRIPLKDFGSIADYAVNPASRVKDVFLWLDRSDAKAQPFDDSQQRMFDDVYKKISKTLNESKEAGEK